MTRLSVLLGPGGVGKTTLAAAYAMASARRGRRVGLLGIDPSYRLQDALGLRLGDVPQAVPEAPGLQAAILVPGDCLRRWALSQDEPDDVRLLHNPMFLALADRLASATDVLAAARVVEWAEREPALDELVVDTAPGLHALEFLRRPAAVRAFLEGRLVGALRWLASVERRGRFRAASGPARRLLAGLARIGGTTVLLELAELLSLVQRPFDDLVRRLERMQRWLRSDDAHLVVVASARDASGAKVARRIAEELPGVARGAFALVINRALDPGLGAELGDLDADGLPPGARAVVRCARAWLDAQSVVTQQLGASADRRVILPARSDLDGPDHAEALAHLGETLLQALWT